MGTYSETESVSGDLGSFPLVFREQPSDGNSAARDMPPANDAQPEEHTTDEQRIQPRFDAPASVCAFGHDA